MTDARFLSNNSVTIANHVKCKTLIQGSWGIKSLTTIEIGQRVRSCGATLYQKVEIFAIMGSHSRPSTHWREILHGQADPRASRLCQVSLESVQRDADFRNVSKFSPGSLPLCDNPAGNKLCGRPPQYAPAPCKLTFDFLTLKVVSESRVTWATSVPILVF